MIRKSKIKKLYLDKLQKVQGVRSGNPNKCCVPNCSNDSYYENPDYLCSNHWAEWWADNLECSTEAEYIKVCKSLLNTPDVCLE